MGSNEPGFDPGRYLTKISGKDYLEVKWRLVWIRTNEPDAKIETQLVSVTEQQAIFKATVTLSSGAVATGYGSETPRDFGDFIEKAETKAVGRALGMLGYGTQFSYDFDEDHRIVDSPVQRPQELPPRDRTTTQNAIPPHQNGNGNGHQPPANGQAATPRQIQFIESLARDKGINLTALDEASDATYGVPYSQLDKRNASSFIEWLNARPVHVPGADPDPMFGKNPDRFTH